MLSFYKFAFSLFGINNNMKDTTKQRFKNQNAKKLTEITVSTDDPEYYKHYRVVQREHLNQKSREYAEQNREKRREAWRIWSAKNKQKIYEKSAFERASKQQRTPPWVDRKALQEIYFNRPEGHHVDHIIPLNGKDVCGLHVPWNLQYLTEEENLKKSNKVVIPCNTITK